MIQKLNTKRGGFTLVEIMIVVAIIALLAAIAIPNFLRARKRSQSSSIKNDLRIIDAAVDQYAIEYGLVTGNTVTWDQVKLYLKPATNLYTTGLTVVKSLPTYEGQTFVIDNPVGTPIGTNAGFSDVAAGDFWSPYNLR